jgi:hypothetical protein
MVAKCAIFQSDPNHQKTLNNYCMMNEMNEMPRDRDGYSPLYYQSLLIQTIRNEVEEIQAMDPRVSGCCRFQLSMMLTAANKAEKALNEMRASWSQQSNRERAEWSENSPCGS